MPTFMQSLAANPSGSSGIYGQPGAGGGDEDVLSLVNRIKDREMSDFKSKANFMSDLSLKQERLRNLYNPENFEPNMMTPKQPTTQLGAEPGAISPLQKAELGIRQQGVAQEGQRLAQQAKLGQEGLDIKSKQEQLNQQKSDQINAQKQADLERKIDEANAKIEASKAAMEQRAKTAEDQIKAHKEYADAVEARHKLEIEQKDHQFNTAQETHKQQIKAMEDRLKQQGRTRTTTAISPEGTSKTVTIERGAAAGRVTVKGKDGQTYTIPEDKLPEWNSQHAPEGSSEEQQ